MGLFRRSYSEMFIRLGEGDAAAYRYTKEVIADSFDPKWLRIVAKGTIYSDLSQAASARADYLAGLSRRERKKLEKEYKEKKIVQDAKQQEALKQFNEAAQDKERPEYWLKKLYENYARENNVGREHIEEHLLAYGDAVYPHVRDYIFSLAFQYNEYTRGINEIRYGTNEGQRAKAIIEAYTNGMSYGIIFLGKFENQNCIQDIPKFYDYINSNIYSDPASGFSDCFNAVHIRQDSVRAMGIATKNLGESVSFYIKALKDESRFVRWVAIDNLKEQWTPEEVSQNSDLRQALTKALYLEDNGVSNRKKSLEYLLNL